MACPPYLAAPDVLPAQAFGNSLDGARRLHRRLFPSCGHRMEGVSAVSIVGDVAQVCQLFGKIFSASLWPVCR